MTGRPSTFTADIAATICERIAEGESLVQICRDANMPHRSTVFDWLARDKEFADRYARAREAQADAIFEGILDIADDGRNDWMAANSDDEEAWKLNGEHVQRSKLRVDARKWIAARLAPKKYGDRVTQELTGADGGPLTVQVVRFTDADDGSFGGLGK